MTMSKTKIAALTLVTLLSTGALLAAGTTLAQQAVPGYGQGPQQGPCPWGQGTGRGGWNDSGDRTASQIERMAWRLNLTPAQKAELDPILRKRDELRTAQRQAMRQEIAGVLTPEQLAQFDQMGPGRGGRMGRGMGPGMGPGGNPPTSGGQP